MAENKDILELFKEHNEQDRKDYATINKNISKLRGEVSELRTEVSELKTQVQPMVVQDEHLKWAAQKITKWLKIGLIIISILAATIAAYKGLGGK